jgi:hypothetical protein
MTKQKILLELIEIQKIVWKGDDQMSKSILFELQHRLAELVLGVANGLNKSETLVELFPWLYKVK